MKILPKSARETKNAFFRKKGWALHSILVYTRKSESHQLDIQVFDHWLADTCQDAWFTASSLHAVIESLKVKPDWVTFLSDNGPYYYNADLMLILGHWNEWYNISVKKWGFLEAGEAKTSIDFHHAQVCIDCSNNLENHHYYLLNHWLQISHVINRYVRLGFNINEGVDIENAIQGICGISIAYLEPERKKESGRKKKIQYQEIPIGMSGTGRQKLAKIAQFEKRPLEKPNPQVSDHSIPTSNWNIPLSHKSKINTNRLIIEELKKQLKEYGVDTDVSNNRVILAEILQNKLNDEISSQNIDVLNTEIIDTDLGSRQVLNHTSNFALSSGWALKENQKFGKKGGGKQISKNVIPYLEAYFLARDINKSKKYTAQEMHNELKGLVEEEVLEEEEIPKISTISNWIS
ncbi:hypothetical protein RirG_019730 [Rhizophagus irregularis DAOM 197198w]|uniref:Uncharacterized protein n=1 Tax=Rhizophagus irregularis (strain DAOM 197198w) TaxID=1432141 RepID=A0A015KE43_RHIIW|nr:hypothetical protein RirG_019730 [Rhizophagus irregularis DAOM 197198w]